MQDEGGGDMKLRLTIPTLALLALAAAPLLAVSPVNKSFFGGVAIDGYDPVAYFTDSKPVRGTKQLTHTWNGATWQFASAEHRDLFAADPEKYAPQYGGWCAYAVAHNSTADVDPEAWTIHDGKLYLNYDTKVRAKWLANRDAFIAQADANWPRLVDR
jgi:YHS domain-containing protein